jgi:hypothetical protein
VTLDTHGLMRVYKMEHERVKTEEEGKKVPKYITTYKLELDYIYDYHTHSIIEPNSPAITKVAAINRSNV